MALATPPSGGDANASVTRPTAGASPSRLANITHVLEWQLLLYRRSWRGSMALTFVQPLLFLLSLGLGLGELVDDGSGNESLQGIDYAAFLAPGLLTATAMQIGAGEGAWAVLVGVKWRNTFHAVCATPVAPTDLLAGRTIWISLRIALAGVCFSAIVAVFGVAPFWRGLAATPIAMLTGVAFAIVFTAYTSTLESDYGITGLFRFVIFPLFLFSGSFFPIEQLPDWMEPFAALSPLWHGVEPARAVMLGTSTAWPVVAHLAVLIAMTTAGWLWAQRTFGRRLYS